MQHALLNTETPLWWMLLPKTAAMHRREQIFDKQVIVSTPVHQHIPILVKADNELKITKVEAINVIEISSIYMLSALFVY